MKKIFALIVVFVMLSAGVNAAFEKVNTYNNNFCDVSDTAWYAENVKTAYELGFMNGKTENTFDPDGKVSVSEAIALGARLHALYNDKIIESKTKDEKEFRFDFDDNTPFVDLSARNSRLDFGIALFKAKGGVENGMLVMTADSTNGNYDPGFFVEGLELDTSYYNVIKVRMKRDALPNKEPDKPRKEHLSVYFETTAEGSLTESKCVSYDLKNISDLSQWFEVEIDMSKHAKYNDYLTGIRFDTTNNNGKYYIDYIAFTTNGKSGVEKWYEKYVDYAVSNGIIEKNEYLSNQMTDDITRRELCDIFASALPETHFNAINDIKGIPDIEQAEKNSDVYLMLYRAGILLGADSKGNFLPDNYIKRSEISAIINRIAIPESRIKGMIDADWSASASEDDIEFESDSWLQKLSFEAETTEIKDGKLILKAKERPNGSIKYCPRVIRNGISIDAEKYSKIRIRMRPDFSETVEKFHSSIYFMTSGDSAFAEAKSFHCTLTENNVPDANGWYIQEFDLRVNTSWKGKITAFRYDPAYYGGTYEIDYIRFVEREEDYNIRTHEELINAGYTATRLLRDEGFERGLGVFRDYVEDKSLTPLWNLSPMYTKYNFLNDRDKTTDKYTIKDTHDVSTVTYNPEEKSLTMRVNTYPCYGGKPHFEDNKSTPDVDESNYTWWPHLLISQESGVCTVDKERNTAAADRMFIEIDIRLLDFNDTTIKEGSMSANFMAYFYLRTDKAPGDLIWFGLNFFNGLRVDGGTSCGWSPDSGAHQYMYKIPQSMVFGGVENSFVPRSGVVNVGEEWKHVRIDVTPHIEQAVEWANRDNIFGVPVTVEDLYFEGANIGFETWGNYDYTVEFKNFNMIAYNKD